MDMKRILQAMDGVSTKPVEGVNSMSKFLRVVKEAELNQPSPQQDPNFAKYVELMSKYDMLSAEIAPDTSGLGVEKNSSPEFVQQVNAIKAQADQLAGPNAQAWDQARKITPQQSQQQLATQLSEGANPHKVSLPVQMAMQHYQKPKAPVERKPRIIDKYFTEAEAEIVQRKQEKRALINQYASVIAERVLMKESAQPIEELSTELLGNYKKAAYADAKKADAEGDYARGDKRFKGINKATNKQFDNDLKKHGQEVSEGADLGGYNTAYLEKIASGAPGKWPCTPAEAKAELQKRIGSEDPHNPAPSSNFQKLPYKNGTPPPTYKHLPAPKNSSAPVYHKLEEDEDLQRLMKLRDQIDEAIKQRLDPKCWKGKHKEGTKIKGGVRVNNCVPNKK